MLPRWRADALLLARGPGYEHWLVLDARDSEAAVPPLTTRVLARALCDEALAPAICELLRRQGGWEPDTSGDDLWRRLEPWLTTGRLVVVERKRALLDIRSDGPMPEPYLEPPPLAEAEPVLLDDAPSLTRSVALVILDFDGDGEPVVNLPLFVDHRDGRINSGKTDTSGKLEVDQLPADHRWSVFSGRNPDA